MKNININAEEIEETILKLEELQENIPFIVSALASMIEVTTENKLFKVESDVNENLIT
ncbi:hypothetical protein R2F61_09190 [Mollicutes bacterium LVI A0078]|nr:hypothetical protein RZE84_08965 [Mollicutes bacterium LVI A0075]WOO90872.1 hypothetical protein R2F61_09190 [Mollicutes bacterium LVI A0078]